MQNGTLLQYFHWYYPSDGTLWKKLKQDLPRLSELGITALWLPPAFKAAEGADSAGYDLYDRYDLGEFDQKGSVRTKYGTRDEYTEAIKAAHQAGIQVYADIVINHMGGGDEIERIRVRKVNPENRNEFISEPMEIEAYTKFTFPGRKGKYSDFIWDYQCFSGIDHAKGIEEKAIYSIQNEYGEAWEEMVTDEKGNFDYLMANDIDFRNPHVVEEMKRWGEWYWKQTGFDGIRLDAVKHISPKFMNEWIDHMRRISGSEMFVVGENWIGDLSVLLKFIEVTEGRISLFDAPLHHQLHTASRSGKDFDLRTIFDNTLVAAKPELAVTIADNHDTQPLQTMEAPIEPWFKPHAYALLLLRDKGYPCVFYPDLFGAAYKDKEQEVQLPAVKNIEKLLQARKLFAYGEQHDYFDHPNCIGWTRSGDHEHPGCAVLVNNAGEAVKIMEIGARYAGSSFRDYLGNHGAEIKINQEGHGEFPVPAGSVTVWVPA